MEVVSIWTFSGIVAGVLLAVYWNNRNAVWGTMTVSLVIGIILAIINPGFGWYIIVKSMIIGTIIGFVFEIPNLVNRIKNNS